MKTAVLILFIACAACKRASPVAPASPVAQLATPPPFAVRFQAYDGIPPNMMFQVSSGGRSEFLKLGERISGTTIRLSDFDHATKELIVTDTATNQRARLTRPEPTNSSPVF